jgi:hypothetical protein
MAVTIKIDDATVRNGADNASLTSSVDVDVVAEAK